MHALMEREEGAGAREEREKYCNKYKMSLPEKKLLDMIFLLFFTGFK